LSHESHVFLNKALVEFIRDGGVTLPQEIREKVHKLTEELKLLQREAKRNYNEDTTKVECSIEELDGLPESLIAKLEPVEGKEETHKFVSLKKTVYKPAIRSINDENVRKRIEAAEESKIADKNGPLLARILELRTEIAELRGYNSASEYETELLMSQTPEHVEEFLSDLTDKLLPMGRRDMEILTEMKRHHTGDKEAVINSWDSSYYLGKANKAKGVDENVLRDYFPIDHFVNMTMEVYKDLLGLKFKEGDCSVWHEDVTCYRTYDAKTDELLGQFYLDLYPRDGKYGHAQCAGIIKRSTIKPD
jgi:Zn-dependent oligopeptidase